MARTVREVMTVDPIICEASAPVTYAARLMRDQDIGDVLIEDDCRDVRGFLVECACSTRNAVVDAGG